MSRFPGHKKSTGRRCCSMFPYRGLVVFTPMVREGCVGVLEELCASLIALKIGSVFLRNIPTYLPYHTSLKLVRPQYNLQNP